MPLKLKILTLGFLVSLLGFGQVEPVWIDGLVNQTKTVPGIKGLDYRTITPGARQGVAFAKSSNGDVYFFGGLGYDANANYGHLNDLWKFDSQLSEWVWISGQTTINSHNPSVTAGTPSSNNFPGGREGAAMWIDESGGDISIYIFGGAAYDSNILFGECSDLWKYSVNNGTWTYVKGGLTRIWGGSYGTKGTSASGNYPGARQNASYWQSPITGKFYMFGGRGYNGGGYCQLNDVWEFDPSTELWTWVSGSSGQCAQTTINQSSVYHPSNIPGARERTATWVVDSVVYIYGGLGYGNTSTYGHLSDMWKYSMVSNKFKPIEGNTATYAVNIKSSYGTKGVENGSNLPGGRETPLFWVEDNTKLMLIGGAGYDQSSFGNLADVWSYDISTDDWTWVGGQSGLNRTPVFGTKGVQNSTNLIGSVYRGVAWKDGNSSDVFVFGGAAKDKSGLFGEINALWKYDVSSNSWIWFKGDDDRIAGGIYGTQNIAGSTWNPGPRSASAIWMHDNGDLYLFGGVGITSNGVRGYLNDLWKYNVEERYWTYLGGTSDNKDTRATYGTQRVGDVNNIPSSRIYTTTWQTSTHLYLFGGYGMDQSNTSGYTRLADTWKYNLLDGKWTYIVGDKGAISSGSYGTINVESATNYPSARNSGTIANDVNAGYVYMYGGAGIATDIGGAQIADLWRFNTTNDQWTWLKGTGSGLESSYNDGINSNTATNNPGSRGGATMVYSNGAIYMFGGYVNSSSGGGEFSNELWKWSGVNWTFLGGAYGPFSWSHNNLGVPDTLFPGPRTSTSSVLVGDKMYIFGGTGYETNGINSGSLNDIWMYDISDSTWTFVGGDDVLNASENAGTMNEFNLSNSLGAFTERRFVSNTTYDQTKVYSFGGSQNFGLTLSNKLWEITLKEGEYCIWDGQNWSPNNPSSSDVAVIKSNTAVPGSFSCSTLIIDNGFSLSLNINDTVTVNKSVVNNGLGILGQGTLKFSGSEVTYISGLMLDVYCNVKVESGTELKTNALLKLAVNSPSVRSTLFGAGTVNGDVTMQAWLDLDGGSSDGRYYYLGAPMTDVSLTDFAESGTNLNTSNSPQGSVWEWDASNASWIPACNGNVNTVLNPGTGVAMYVGSNQYGDFVRADAGTIEVTGTIDNADKSCSLEYNDGQSSGLQFVGGTAVSNTEGWNLISNPFTAYYDWNGQVGQTGLHNAIHVYNGTGYSSYVSNVSVNGGSRYISPFQAFWVQLDSDPGSSTMSLNFQRSNLRINTAQELYKNVADGVYISLHEVLDSLNQDELFVGFDAGATEYYDSKFDARKLLNNPSVPTFYSEAYGEFYSINRISTSDSAIFNVGLIHRNHGATCTIEIDDSDLYSYRSVYLEDKRDGLIHNLTNSPYVFTNDTSFVGERFLIFFSNSLTLDENTQNDHGIYSWSNDGVLTVQSNLEKNFSVNVYDLSGRFITNSSQGTRHSFKLPNGVYMVRVFFDEGSESNQIVLKAINN
ncbi:Kelch repeat-containing protein [Phaeocystidibacter marisrubri]|uniref:T9SS type A sorting domain-containing protein n=1 Tax=Phaeocystidibacter marisrubri TaxID=1577780 RepID=A0A6L3ZK35_9FLAO|nr:kelch repeat-containing protein [Phaeocystidibacter marisrubri]KAB2818197.1 T9SS type A sorting domain-containing protein [Phaeocystidibacter marisrubri]GGH71440.1 hypothetical protein GCM10011318_14400 [Phaeocystidibacter marisrubri]